MKKYKIIKQTFSYGDRYIIRESDHVDGLFYNHVIRYETLEQARWNIEYLNMLNEEPSSETEIE